MDTSPTALFDSYEQDFKQIIGTIKEKLEPKEEDVNKGGEDNIPSNGIYILKGL